MLPCSLLYEVEIAGTPNFHYNLYSLLSFTYNGAYLLATTIIQLVLTA